MTWRQCARAAMAGTLPRRLFLVQGPPSSRSVGLTFDDGPHPEHTPRLLDVLKDHGVPATFFLIGRHAEAHPEIVARIVAEGHAIGGHSYEHGPPDQVSARRLLEEVRRTADLLAGPLGHPTRLFRPPHGKLTLAKLWGLWRAGQSVILWNVDPKDFAGRTSGEVHDRLRARPPRGGDIVLLHDNHPHAAAVLPEFIAAVRARGLEFTTVAPWVGPATHGKPKATVLNP